VFYKNKFTFCWRGSVCNPATHPAAWVWIVSMIDQKRLAATINTRANSTPIQFMISPEGEWQGWVIYWDSLIAWRRLPIPLLTGFRVYSVRKKSVQQLKKCKKSRFWILKKTLRYKTYRVLETTRSIWCDRVSSFLMAHQIKPDNN